MNPRHYLAHVLLQHYPQKRSQTDFAAAVKEHFAKTLSADALTETLRARLNTKRAKVSVEDELVRLERELELLGGVQDERIQLLRVKVEELQKKIGYRKN